MINQFIKTMGIAAFLGGIILMNGVMAQVPRTLGFNVQQQYLKDADFKEIKGLGCNVVRLAFSAKPLMNINTLRWIPENWKRMHALIKMAKQNNMKVIIDPHAIPGATRKWTSLGSDPTYQEQKYVDAFIELWDRIAKECAQYGDVIWAYDLLNEGPPQFRLIEHKSPFTLKDDFFKPAIQAIRKHDKNHNIIMEFVERDFLEGVVEGPNAYGGDLPKSKLLFGPHFYWPHAYTHQGRNPAIKPAGQKYPDPARGWDKARMKSKNIEDGMLQAVIDWGDQYGHWRLFIGEFGAINIKNGPWDTRSPNQDPPKNGGDKWLTDAVRIFNENNWSYTYHAWEENSGQFNVHVPAPRWKLHKALIKETLNGPSDNSAPSKPTNLAATNVTQFGADLNWKKSTDNVGVDHYEVFSGNNLIGTSNTNSLSINWLECEISYQLKVVAVDAVGNTSAASNTVSFTTGACAEGPFLGTNFMLPGLIECEYYDIGGEGKSYHDDASKSGDQNFRTSDNVDVSFKSTASNNYAIGYSNTGEWVQYSVDVSAGTYDLILTYSSGHTTPGDLKVTLDGSQIALFSNVINTGGYAIYKTTTASGISLSSGTNQKLRLEYVNGANFDLDAIEFIKTDDDNGGDDCTLSTSTSNLSFDAPGGSQTFMVTTNESFSVSDNKGFISTSKTGNTVTVTLAANSGAERSGTVSVSGCENKSITIQQAAAEDDDDDPISSSGLETFDKMPKANQWANGSFNGNDGITWSYKKSKRTTVIDGKTIKLDRSAGGELSATIPGGIGSLSFDAAPTGKSKGTTIEVMVNGNSIGTFDVPKSTTKSFSVNVNMAGDVNLLFKGTNGSDPQLDNIKWAGTSGARLIRNAPISAFESKLYPNPSNSGTIHVVTNQNTWLEIVSMNGKRVTAKWINGSQTIHDLPSGVYLVRMTASERTKTQKLIVK